MAGSSRTRASKALDVPATGKRRSSSPFPLHKLLWQRFHFYRYHVMSHAAS